MRWKLFIYYNYKGKKYKWIESICVIDLWIKLVRNDNWW